MTNGDQRDSDPGRKGLRGGALSLAGGIVIGMASAAPGYSLAASLGLLVVLVGEKTPAVLLLAFVPMYLIAVAFKELNKAEPDCGTTFTWATRAFGPWAGWLGGWALMAACIIIMANLAQIAGAYTFRLVGLPDLADSTLWTTVAGVAWIALMTWVCQRGIDVAAWVQTGLVIVELLVLAVFACVAFTDVAAGDAIGRAEPPSLSWLSPFGIAPSDLVAALVIALFLYWGWDTTVSVNEEYDEPRRTPGRAAVLSTLLLVLTYVLVAMAAVAFAGTGAEGIGLANPDNVDDAFALLGPAVFGDNALGKTMEILLILSVLTSAAASTQTTILPTARAALSMGAYRALPHRFAEVHPINRTPAFATWATGGVSIAFYVGLTVISENVLLDSIAAVGLLIAFYYGMTGFACVWYFRRELHGRALWTKGVMPGTGGVLLLGAFIYSAIGFAAPDGGETTVLGLGGPFVIGIGALAFGAALMVAYSVVAPAFFRGKTLPRLTHQQRRPGYTEPRTMRIPRVADRPAPPAPVVPAPRKAAAPAAAPPPEDEAARLFDPTR